MAEIITIETPSLGDRGYVAKRVFVVCRSGRRSLRGVAILGDAGVEATSVAGGTLGGIAAGLPIATRPAGVDA